MRRFGNAAAALAALPDLARRGGGAVAAAAQPRAMPSARSPRVERGRALPVPRTGPAIRALLAEIDDAPPMLIAQRRLALLERSRASRSSARATPRPRRVASRASLAHALGQRGLRGGLRPGARDRRRGARRRARRRHDRRDRQRHRHRLSARARRAAGAIAERGPAARRAAAGHRAARAPLPQPQPDHRRARRAARWWSRRRRGPAR